MASPSQSLVLRFGADSTALRSTISQLASEAPRALVAISQASIGASSTLRNSLIAAGADGTRTVSAQLLTLARDTNNLKLIAGLAGEGMKTAFAINHPILAIGLNLLSQYRVALGLVAAGAITAHEALGLMAAQYERINHIIEGAEKAGVSATLFQAWTDQAAHLRLTVKEAEEAIIHAGKTLTSQLDPNKESSVVSGARDLEEKLGRPTRSFGVLNEAGTVEEMHRGALLLVKDYQDAEAELRAQGRELSALEAKLNAVKIATEVWGEAGKRVAEGIRDGSLDIDEFIAKSEAAGRVWSDEIVEAQKQTNKALEEARKHLGDELTPSMEVLERLTLAVLRGWTNIIEAIAKTVGGVNDLGRAIANNPAIALLGSLLAGETTAKLKEQARANSDPSGGKVFSEAFAPYLAPRAIPLPPARPANIGDRVREPRARSGGGSSAESIDQVERYIQSLEKSNAALEGEAAAIGKSNVEREKSIDLAKAEEVAKERGTALTDVERQKIEQLAEAHVTLRKKIDEANKEKQAAEAQQKFFANSAESGIEKLIVDHQKFADVLRDVAKEMERAALKAILLGEGPLGKLLGGGAKGGLFGGLFGGGSSGDGKSSSGGLFGAVIGGLGKLFPFADGGMVTLAHLPRYADGGAVAPDGGFPILAHPGEIILNMAQQRNVAANMGAPNVSVRNYAAGVKVTPQITGRDVTLIVRQELAGYHQRQSDAPFREQ